MQSTSEGEVGSIGGVTGPATVTPGDVLRAVGRVLGRRAVGVTHMEYGGDSVSYRVDLDGGTSVLVRTHSDARRYAGTIANLDILRGLGVPVPTVLAADLSQTVEPFAYLVTDVFRGRDLRYELPSMTSSQLAAVAEQVVEFQRLAATLPARGYGFTPIGTVAPHATWSAAVRADIERHPRTDVGDRALTALDAVADRMDTALPTCFLDDLTTKNVIVDRGVLRGVVDFDVVCHGDPMYWLALTRVAILLDVPGELGSGYVRELERRHGVTENLALSSALHAAAFVAVDAGGHDDPTWRRRLTDAADRWLAEG